MRSLLWPSTSDQRVDAPFSFSTPGSGIDCYIHNKWHLLLLSGKYFIYSSQSKYLSSTYYGVRNHARSYRTIRWMRRSPTPDKLTVHLRVKHRYVIITMWCEKCNSKGHWKHFIPVSTTTVLSRVLWGDDIMFLQYSNLKPYCTLIWMSWQLEVGGHHRNLYPDREMSNLGASGITQ